MFASVSISGAALFGIIFAVTNLLAAQADKDPRPADDRLPPAA